MSTYSTGQAPVDALKLQDFRAVLNILPDNTQKLIAPKDVRDSLYTVWENIAFKPTKVASSTVEYIGIDQDFLRQKVFIGKKKVEGLDIMNPTLLGSDVDVFFYNNKEEPLGSYNTKIAILAGTGGFSDAPYLESAVVTSYLGNNYLDLGIINPSYIVDGSQLSGGNINIKSDYGYISLNGLVFPKQSENADTTNNGKFLQYNLDGSTAYAVWADSFSVDSLSASGTVSITGSPVLVNGLDINFTDSTPIPTSVGGILAGETFSNVPLTEMFRKLLYPYLAPNVSISFESPIIESGDLTAAPKLFYTITRPGTYSLTNLALNPPSIDTNYPFINYTLITQTGANGFVYPTLTNQQLRVDVGSGYKTNTFTLSITDEYPTTKTSTTSFDVVLPWYYGTSQTATSSTAGINSILGSLIQVFPPGPAKLTPLLKAAPSPLEIVELIISTAGLDSPLGLGCIYFGYPSSYGNLTDIFDQNDYSIFGFFTQYIVGGVNSPDNYWGGGENRQYKFYIYIGNSVIPTLTTVPALSKYKLVFE
jgi:hypothetical protein